MCQKERKWFEANVQTITKQSRMLNRAGTALWNSQALGQCNMAPPIQLEPRVQPGQPGTWLGKKMQVANQRWPYVLKFQIGFNIKHLGHNLATCKYATRLWQCWILGCLKTFLLFSLCQLVFHSFTLFSLLFKEKDFAKKHEDAFGSPLLLDFDPSILRVYLSIGSVDY